MTKELLKEKNGANPAVYKELLPVIRYVLDMKNFGLKIKPTRNSSEPWKIICFSNSDYAGDMVSRKNIRGFILYVLNVLVSWQSNSQKSVSLSSSEVVFKALSDAVKESMIRVQHLGSMNILVNYPVMVRVDNVGALYMVGNITTTCWTKHVGIKMWTSSTSMSMNMLKMC